MSWVKQNWFKVGLGILISGILIVFVLILIITKFEFKNETSIGESNGSNVLTTNSTDKKEDDNDTFFSHERSVKMLNNDPVALEILKENNLWLLSSNFLDYDGDNEKELAIITSGANCGSCHQNELRIIKKGKVIFYKDTYDVDIWPAKDFSGFMIKYPIFKIEEPLCCPSEGMVESYKVKNGGVGMETFIKISERKEPYPPVITKEEKVSWIGTVVTKMTYGRLRIKSDGHKQYNGYSEFVAEPDDVDDTPERKSKTTANINDGDIVKITGSLEKDEIVDAPWVLIEKIEKVSASKRRWDVKLYNFTKPTKLPDWNSYPVREPGDDSYYEEWSLKKKPIELIFNKLSDSVDQSDRENILYFVNKYSPNFADHYTVVSLGCGTQCMRFVIVDNKTGIVYDSGQGSAWGADFNADSRLFINNPSEILNRECYSVKPEDRSPMCAETNSEYYVWMGDHFDFIGEYKIVFEVKKIEQK